MALTKTRILNKVDHWSSAMSDKQLGQYTAGVFYTNAIAKFFYVGTDDAGNTSRIIPVSATAAEGKTCDVSVVMVAGIIDDTPPAGYYWQVPTPSIIIPKVFPLTGLVIEADSVICDGSNLPTAGSPIYFIDNALLSTSSAGAALKSPIGVCLGITTDTFYRIAFI